MGRRLVLFDLDNTLVDRTATFFRWAAEFCAHHELNHPAALAWLIDEDGDGFRPREGFFSAVRDRFALRASVRELLAAYDQEHPLHYHREPRSISAVMRLRDRGLKVAVVTNGSAAQQVKVERSGLADVVDAVCVSAVVGHRKPASEIFVEAGRRCGVPLAGWMVGDAEADIHGGNCVGLTTIWMSRGRRWEHATLSPHYTVNTVDQATDVILQELADPSRAKRKS